MYFATRLWKAAEHGNRNACRISANVASVALPEARKWAGDVSKNHSDHIRRQKQLATRYATQHQKQHITYDADDDITGIEILHLNECSTRTNNVHIRPITARRSSRQQTAA